MYDRCKRDKIKYSDYDIIIKESWAKFIEYYLLEDIYKKDGHTIWEYRIYDYTFGQEIPNNRTYGIIPSHISRHSVFNETTRFQCPRLRFKYLE